MRPTPSTREHADAEDHEQHGHAEPLRERAQDGRDDEQRARGGEPERGGERLHVDPPRVSPTATRGRGGRWPPSRAHAASGMRRMSQPIAFHGQTGTVLERTPRSIKSTMRRAPSSTSMTNGRDLRSRFSGVSMKPGAMSTMSMPSPRTSPRAAWDQTEKPAFDAL